MNVIRIFRYTIKAAAWATPHVQRWWRKRNMNATEAERHFQARNYPEAAKYYEAALADAKRRRASLERRLNLSAQIAECQRGQKNLDAALATMEDVIGQAAALGPKHGAYGRYLDKLSSIRADRGELPQALEASRTALQIARHNPLTEPNVLGERCYRLAALEQQCGNSAETLRLLRESMTCFEKAYGPEHEETANQLSRLGIALQADGKHDEAITFLERAAVIHRETIGLDAPEALVNLEHMAQIQHSKGNMEQAGEMYDRLLRFKEKQLNIDPLDHGCLLFNASMVHRELGNDARAFEYLFQASRLLDRNPRELDPILEALADLYDDMRRPADADQVRKRLMKIREGPVPKSA
jgi:tetratricopeptide (TPR) repeat protein